MDNFTDHKKNDLKQISHVLNIVALCFCGVYGLGQGFQLWTQGAVFIHLDMMLFSLLSYFLGFCCLFTAAAYSKKYHNLTAILVLGVLLLTSLARGYNHLRYINPQYGTDAVAFNHYAAELALQGKNPYLHSMALASERFGVPKRYHTLDDTGKMVESLSYPAQSFLLYMPFVALGVENVNGVNLLAHLIAILLIFLLVPWWMRSIAPLVMFFEPEFVNFTVGGVTDILFLPFLLGVAYFWKEKRILAAILWGFACGIKQGPWLLAPFMAVSLYHECKLKQENIIKEFGRYFAIAAAAFIIPNIPFMLSPIAWFKGVFTPMGRELVLYGSGLVNITTSGSIALPRGAYTALALGAMGCLAIIYFFKYKKIFSSMWIFPGFILWLTPRSFHSYFMYWVPVLIVSLSWEVNQKLNASDEDPPLQNALDKDPPLQKGRKFFLWLKSKWGLFILFLIPFLGFTIAAFVSYISSSGLYSKVVLAKDSKNIGVLDNLTVEVENKTEHALVPRFAILWRGNNLFFWKIQNNNTLLKPLEKRLFKIAPRNYTESPPHKEIFRVRVYNSNNNRFYLSQPFGPVKRTASIYNKNFRYWDDVSFSPIGWTRTPRAIINRGGVAKRVIKNREAVCLQVFQKGDKEWNRVSLSQKILKNTQTLHFSYYANDNPVGTIYPQQLMGIELEFPKQEIVVISPNSNVSIPKIFRKSKQFFVHLPYKLNSWQKFSIDIKDIAQYLGYKKAVSVDLRLTASRHRSLFGDLAVYYREVYGLSSLNSSAFRISKVPSLPENYDFSEWNKKKSVPTGWALESPQAGCKWHIAPGPQEGVIFSILKNTKGPEWTKLALVKRLNKKIRRLEIAFFSKHFTKNLKKPTIFLGFELASQEIHVFTLCPPDYSGPLKTTRGNFHFHAVLAKPGESFAKITLDLSKFSLKNPHIKLLLNIHQSRIGVYKVYFKPIKIN